MLRLYLMDVLNAIFQIVILIFSVVVHEVSHGVVANRLGDPTAKYAGRLTLNPLKHLDPFGSVILPILTFMFGGFIFGWARPVPYNPNNLRDPKRGAGLIGAAGPISNALIATVFALVLRFNFPALLPETLAAGFVQILVFIILINLILAIFNLVPIPPLDGSKVLFAFLPNRYGNIQMFLERWGLFLIILFLFFFAQILLPIVGFLFKLLVGSSLLL